MSNTEKPQSQNIGRCPRCGYPIFADLDLTVVPGKPFLKSDTQRWVASASVRITAARIEHACSEDDPPTAFEEAIDEVVAGARGAMGDA